MTDDAAGREPAYPRFELPIKPPYAPMEAKPAAKLPPPGPWRYEPKWDGFRVLVFREGDRLALQSKRGLPLGRYFPELTAATRALPADRLVLDGEIVIPHATAKGEQFSFDDLLQRIHPAASRVAKLAAETPARVLLFDALVVDGAKLTDQPLDERRARLEALVGTFPRDGTFRLCPSDTTLEAGQAWLEELPSNVSDGVIAKRRDLPYRAGLRDGMLKVKRLRTVDCVVGGFRYGAKGGQVGSLLLGLYDEHGRLHHVGHTSSIAAKDKPALTKRLEALRGESAFGEGGGPGGPSRWRPEAETVWEALAPTLVVEVRYDHWSGGRIRHGSKLVRWRPDKDPRTCTFDQVPAALAERPDL